MTIQNDELDTENINNKRILFRDIIDCYLPKQDIENYDLPKNWKWAFYVKCLERLYILTTKTSDERNMWMAGFRYLLAST